MRLGPLSFILAFVPFRTVTSGLRCPFPLAYAVDHEAAFAVNAALMAGQRQHCT